MDQEEQEAIKQPTAGFCHATKFIRLNFFSVGGRGGGAVHPAELVTCSNISCCFLNLTANRLLCTPHAFTCTETQNFVHDGDQRGSVQFSP